MKPKNSYFKSLIVCGEGSFFYQTAQVSNLQKKRDCIRIGRNTHIHGDLMVFTHGGRISIGDYCFVGEGTRIWSAASIEIGNRVLIAHNVNIHDNNSHPVNKTERHEHAKNLYAGFSPPTLNLNEKPVTIGDDAWIGFNAIILKGVSIGEGAIVGAGTLVNRDVPPHTIVAGNPMEVIGQV